MAKNQPMLNMRFKDKQGEMSTVSVPVPELTAANFDAQVLLYEALVTELSDAAKMSLGQVQSWWITAHVVDVSSAAPASAFAQREIKWLVRGHGATSMEKRSFEIPCANLAVLPSNSEFVDTDNGIGLALKNAIEAVAKIERDSGNFEVFEVDSIQFVSRKG